MPTEHRINENTIRIVDDDGRESRVYREAEGLLAPFTPDECIEVAVHDLDGTTRAYEYDDSLLATILHGNKGALKE
ncbi:MAG: hypothetical protein WA060_01375 [Minisyncoccia bacterium]